MTSVRERERGGGHDGVWAAEGRPPGRGRARAVGAYHRLVLFHRAEQRRRLLRLLLVVERRNVLLRGRGHNKKSRPQKCASREPLLLCFTVRGHEECGEPQGTIRTSPTPLPTDLLACANTSATHLGESSPSRGAQRRCGPATSARARPADLRRDASDDPLCSLVRVHRQATALSVPLSLSREHERRADGIALHR